jgi:hypothetical protein
MFVVVLAGASLVFLEASISLAAAGPVTCMHFKDDRHAAASRTPTHCICYDDVPLQDAMKAAAEQDASAAAAARNRADQLMAEAEVAAAERLLQAAEIEYSSAMQEQLRLSRAVGQVRRGI